MENFLIRHTIRMPPGQEPLMRHYSVETSSKAAALRIAFKIDDGNRLGTKVEVVGHVVNRWPSYDI
jgi:hypothetical protein